MPTPYRPIDCGLYDQLEVYAMRKTTCQIEYLNEKDQSVTISSRIADVFAKDGEEFISLPDGQLIRLDRLRRVNDRDVGEACNVG